MDYFILLEACASFVWGKAVRTGLTRRISTRPAAAGRHCRGAAVLGVEAVEKVPRFLGLALLREICGKFRREMPQISRKGAICSVRIKQFEAIEGLWSFSTASLADNY